MNKLILIIGLLVSAPQFHAQTMTKHRSALDIRHISKDLSISDLANPSWGRGEEITVDRYWSGDAAPSGRTFKAGLLWSDTALYVCFEARQTEPLIVSEKANLASKTLKLWDRDVCEIFIAPDRSQPRKYFEFEVAPNGEWVDLAIDLTSGKRITDWDYSSGMQSAAEIEKDKVVMAIKIEWKAFGKTPKKGDVWLGNLFRCVGRDPTRGYLSWQPTLTKEPAFHVPEKFGEFVFR